MAKRITVCLLTGIGNTIMTTPLVEALKSLNYEVSFLIHPMGSNLLEIVKNHKAKIGLKTKGLVAIPTLWQRCMALNVSSEQIIAKNLDPKKYHESEANMTIARQLGYKGETPKPKLYGVKPEKNDTIIIATGCTQGPEWEKKKYPYWEELCQDLMKNNQLSFIGTKTESKPWMDKIGLNLCGKKSLTDSINWIAGAKAAICIDNGIAHVAAAVNIQTNVIYGPTIIAKNKQIGEHVNIISASIDCSPCQLTKNWNTCSDYRCMKIQPKHLGEQLRLCIS